MNTFLAGYLDPVKFDELLKNYLDSVEIPDSLVMPMNDALIGVGKRLRPALCYIGAEISGADPKRADFCAAAIECVHCYSLVHDDLECMDDDAFRHGKPSIHAKYGEAVAVLCGDALLNLAFEILIGGCGDKASVKAASVIARKAGVSGMIGGQADDVSGRADRLDTLKEMYRKKTGELLAAALMSGAAAGGADDETLSRLEIYAHSAGIAYQFRDDVLDVTSTSQQLGKDIGSDSDNDKVTAVTLLGIDGAEAACKEYFARALDAIAPLGKRAEALSKLVSYLQGRTF